MAGFERDYEFTVRLNKLERVALDYLVYKRRARSRAVAVRAAIKALAIDAGFDLKAEAAALSEGDTAATNATTIPHI